MALLENFLIIWSQHSVNTHILFNIPDLGMPSPIPYVVEHIKLVSFP